MPNRKFPSSTQSPMKSNHQKFQKTPQNGCGEKPKTILQPDRKLQQQQQQLQKQQQQQQLQATLHQDGNASSVGQAKSNKNQNPNQVQQPKCDVPPAEGPRKKQKNPQQQPGNVNTDFLFLLKSYSLFWGNGFY